MSVAARCSQVCADAMSLAAHPVDTFRAASLLLRGCPQLAAWVAGWASREFTARVVTGHALSAIPAGPLAPITAGLAAQRADAVLTSALTDTFGADYAAQVEHPVTLAARRPSVAGLWLATTHRRRYAAHTTNIAYGPNGRDHLLDIWRLPEQLTDRPAPVLLQVPGGAWAISDKRGQAYPLMSRMVELGWICVSINYSRSPRSAWPAHIVDVKRAIAWVRQNIAEYGGDPDFIAITGGSAGAHVGALAALTANDPDLQPGFEYADTTVQAAVPYYGAYDLTNTEAMHQLMLPFLEQFVMRARLADNRELYESASPIFRAHRDAPPFFVLHGRDDAVIPSAQGQSFTAALRAAGASTVAHAELPNAHHAFDMVATVRSQIVADAVASFLGITYARHMRAEAISLDVCASPAG
ncbi:alpha/beta hydrolase [Mycolicibacterium komossense]|uniref:Alpha/beta hydrolase n=1 Tax=Mycolicibacterium komossense TaxID=1779 RepID=A0ABT3C7D1_9MYCO|nr:alpha/beta hydrolase [Mycolicibacterium komossense]MCV7225368.1 alpha/beta hydrolase [Mycolicibacterium komossense]